MRALVSLADYERAAAGLLAPMAHEYLAGASGDEVTLRLNRESFDALGLEPRALVDVSRLDTSVELLGRRLAHPILLAPAGFHRLFHAEGEPATARGAAAAEALLVASSVANTPLDEVARASDGPKWFQLYVQRDRGWTRELVQRAQDAGFEALCLTVDTPVLGARDREKRSGFALPSDLTMANFQPLEVAYTSDVHHDPHDIYNPYLDPAVTWKDLEWLRGLMRVPLVLKGILSPGDARLAVDHGADAVIVSNHGGRNLDTVPAAIDALPRVADAIAGRLPVLVDGGIRRGTDVVKCIALGARAVLIGRPYVWGLAVDGARGVERVVRILRREFEAAMALCGATSLSALDPDLVRAPGQRSDTP